MIERDHAVSAGEIFHLTREPVHPHVQCVEIQQGLRPSRVYIMVDEHDAFSSIEPGGQPRQPSQDEKPACHLFEDSHVGPRAPNERDAPARTRQRRPRHVVVRLRATSTQSAPSSLKQPLGTPPSRPPAARANSPPRPWSRWRQPIRLLALSRSPTKPQRRCPALC